MNKFLWMLLVALPLVACDSHDRNSRGAQSTAVVPNKAFQRQSDFATVQKGFRVYRQHCASCHGSSGQGAPNWQQAGPDGKYPAPPLNGTGHAWHHPTEVLERTIRQGTAAIGGNMPAWKDKLTDADIMAVIAWFQSRWPDELYQAWARMDQDSRRSR